MRESAGVRRAALIALMIVSATAVPSAPASADPALCTSSHSGVTFDQVVVPAGSTCSLSGSTVLGRVVVEPGGSFGSFLTTIGGNVMGGTGSSISMFLTEVRGSVMLGGPALVCFTTIAGNLVVRGAQGDPSAAVTFGGRGIGRAGNRIGGSVLVESNAIPVLLARNTIGGRLVCTANTAVEADGNTAQGGSFGQCAGG